MSNVILRAENLHKTYYLGRTRLPVLRGVSISVRAGEFVAVTGASGSGKSTLLHVLGALDVPQRGQVYFREQPVFPREAERGFPSQESVERGENEAVQAGFSVRLDSAANRLRNESFGFVFQFYHLLPEYDILENVLLPNMVGQDARGWFADRTEHVSRARALLRTIGLEERLNHRPNELSGGERQRVAIARALIMEPAVLLADEPTGNLDTKTGREILALLRNLNAAGQTIIMVTHDPEVAGQAHRIVHLADGRIQ
jgi:lipoprotein-releasing system ATP-binding protein